MKEGYNLVAIAFIFTKPKKQFSTHKTSTIALNEKAEFPDVHCGGDRAEVRADAAPDGGGGEGCADLVAEGHPAEDGQGKT